MSRSSNKMKIECLMNYLPTLKRKVKVFTEDKTENKQFRVNIKGSHKR